MILDYFRLGFKNIRKRRLRSWLTMLGIFIGIAAVVALISIGQGLQVAITQQFESLGKDKIIIQPKILGPPGSYATENLKLTSKDINTIEKVQGVQWVVGYLSKQGQAEFKDEAKFEYVIGLEPSEMQYLLEMQPYGLLEGRLLKQGDKYNIMVGYSHAYGNIWNKPATIGDTVKIQGQEFRIVGVFERSGNPFDDGSFYIPKDTMKELYNITDEESQLVVKVEQGEDPVQISKEIERKLRRERNEKEGQETFQVQTADQLLKSFTDIFNIVQAVFVGIAAISLVVGGVGIMNTMYTAVLERTREIGIMKAVGAKNSDILTLFLVESGILGLVGGAIGVLIGVGLSEAVSVIASQALGTNLLKAYFPLYLIVGALAFSFIVGCASGALPAVQASKMRPVDALRYE
jgi:putative ABC transport system permease protein